MAHKILLRKKRFTATDLQREKLQTQISTYSARHHADAIHRDLRAARKPVAAEPDMPLTRLNGWIDQTLAVVDSILAVQA